MPAFLSYEEVKQWRSSPEKISLEEFARRLGKLIPEKKQTNDICDIIQNQPELVVQEKQAASSNLSLNFTFKKKLTPREETVLNYFAKNKNKTVFAKELAKILGLPNDYVYKYIKNLREKLAGNILVNDNNGGYILKV